MPVRRKSIANSSSSSRSGCGHEEKQGIMPTQGMMTCTTFLRLAAILLCLCAFFVFIENAKMSKTVDKQEQDIRRLEDQRSALKRLLDQRTDKMLKLCNSDQVWYGNGCISLKDYTEQMQKQAIEQAISDKENALLNAQVEKEAALKQLETTQAALKSLHGTYENMCTQSLNRSHANVREMLQNITRKQEDKQQEDKQQQKKEDPQEEVKTETASSFSSSSSSSSFSATVSYAVVSTMVTACLAGVVWPGLIHPSMHANPDVAIANPAGRIQDAVLVMGVLPEALGWVFYSPVMLLDAYAVDLDEWMNTRWIRDGLVLSFKLLLTGIVVRETPDANANLKEFVEMIVSVGKVTCSV
jgi:hypothetical protein